MTGAGAKLPSGSLSFVPIWLAFFSLRGLLSSHCQGWLPREGIHQPLVPAVCTTGAVAGTADDACTRETVAPAAAEPSRPEPTSTTTATRATVARREGLRWKPMVAASPIIPELPSSLVHRLIR